MKKDPWVRLGMRMRPKIREKPAERRKSRPPRVMLLTASTNQRFMGGAPRSSRGAPRWPPCLLALQRRVVARVDGLGEEPLLVVRPELAHIGIGLDGRVDELVALALALPDVDVPHHVAEMVEAEGPARRVGEGYRPEGLDQGLAVV